MNTTLEFDVTLQGWGGDPQQVVRMQNGINSIFQRVRLLYGSTPLEDIINYSTVVRALNNWTSTNCQGIMDQTSIAEGWGGFTWGTDSAGLPGMVNVRQRYIQGISTAATTVTAQTATSLPSPAAITAGNSFGVVPSTGAFTGYVGNGATQTCTRRYQVNFALGLFTQDKLIPTKFMASQLAIELTLANATDAVFTAYSANQTGAGPTYGVGNVSLIPEILEFDASYDSMFLRGLRENGM